MARWIVRVALIVVVGFTAFMVLAPLAPEGSVLREWRQEFSDVMRVWWGYPTGLGA